MNKKILASVISLTLVFGTALSTSVYAEDAETTVEESISTSYDASVVKSGTCGEKATWTLDADGTLTISGTGKMDTSLYPWSEYKSTIKAVVIEEGITDISDKAFEDFTAMTSVSFPKSLKTIGVSAFHNCSALKAVKFPENLETVGAYAFILCSSLETVDIPASLTYIDFQVFHGCGSMRHINVAAGNPKYVSVDDVLYSKDMKEIITYASKRPGTTFTVPESVEKLCVTSIDFCDELTTVYIGKNVKDFAFAPFYSSMKLTDIIVSEDNPYFKSVDGVVYSKDGKTLVAVPAGKDYTSFDIPSGVTNIGIGALATTKIPKINIPDTVKVIDNAAFYANQQLTDITIPNSVTEIVDQAFMYCTKLKAVNVPASVKKIADLAFYNCTAMDSITIENKDCEIADSSNAISYNTVIKGHDGSTAEAYAKKYDRKFVSLDKKNSKGDVNLDGDINVTDIAMVASHIKGIKALTGDGLKNADVNGDGNVNVTDIAMIASHIKGIKALS